MSLMFLRAPLSKIVYSNPVVSGKAAGLVKVNGGIQLNPEATSLILCATLKATHGGKYPYPGPFPKEGEKPKHLSWWRMLNNHSRHRITTENSKVITVEGNLAVGKNNFAQRLCREFDLKLFPSVKDSNLFINPRNGLDLRMINPYLPDSAKVYDMETFVKDKDPQLGRVAVLQTEFYKAKFRNYAAALHHLFTTGQGVVVVNSVFADEVFLRALNEMGYVTKNYIQNYYKMKNNTLCELYRPHLCVYLDAPISTSRKNLNKRNDPKEARFNDKFLQSIEAGMKNRFQKKMRANSEVVDIDWEEPADDLDMDWIAEELTQLQLEPENLDDPKFEDWYLATDDDMDLLTQQTANENWYTSLFENDRLNFGGDPFCPELFFSPKDGNVVKEVYKKFYKLKPDMKNPYLKFF